MKLLSKEQQESYEKKIENKYLKDKKYREVRDHCHHTGENRRTAHSICNLTFSVPKKIPILLIKL